METSNKSPKEEDISHQAKQQSIDNLSLQNEDYTIEVGNLTLFMPKRAKKEKQTKQLTQLYALIYNNFFQDQFNWYFYEDFKYVKQSRVKKYQHQQLNSFHLQYRLKIQNIPSLIDQRNQKYKWGYEQNILPSMVHINFPNLIVLNLNSLYIKNIDSLSFMNIPNLRCIQLYNNYIWSLKPLHKSCFKRLQILTLYKNKIKQLKYLQRCNFPKLTEYQLDRYIGRRMYQYEPYIQMANDVNYVFKMRNLQVKKLDVQSYHRVRNLKSLEIMKKLSPRAQIRVSKYKYKGWDYDYTRQQIVEMIGD